MRITSNRASHRCVLTAVLTSALCLPLCAQEAATPAPASGDAATSGEAPATGELATARGRLRGVVTDPDKRPAGGRLVVLASTGEGQALRVTSTDEKGRFQFRDLPPGMYELRLEAEGCEPEVKKGIDVRPPFQNVVDVTLRRAAPGSAARPAAVPAATQAPASAAASPAGERVQGLLRDSEGKAVVEAEVLLVPLAEGTLRQGSSDRQGTFAIDGVAPGGYRLAVRSLGHVPIDISRVDVAPGSGLTLRLSLVDYVLNFVSGKDTRPILERPRQPKGADKTLRALAPEPEPEPLVPPPPEEKSTTPTPADGSDASRAPGSRL